jgi:hypothetical protein
VLTARYAELIWRDRNGLRLLLLQAPVVAIFILLGFTNKPYQGKVLAPRTLTADEREALGELIERARQITRTERTVKGVPLSPLSLLEKIRDNLLEKGDLKATQRDIVDYGVTLARKTYQNNRTHLDRLKLPEQMDYLLDVLEEVQQSNSPVVPDRMIINPIYTYMLLFLIVLIILWFGSNNASKEIVKEEAIYGRERAVNLGILPYLASKFLLLSVITIFQVVILMVMVYGVLGLLGSWLGQQVPEPSYMLQYVPQFGVLAVLAMTSVALGLLLSACVTTPDRANALLPYVMIPQIILGGGILSIRSGPLYYIAVVLSPAYWAYRAIRLGAHDILPKDFPGHMNYEEGAWLPVIAMTIQMVVLLLLTTWFLRQKDAHKG